MCQQCALHRTNGDKHQEWREVLGMRLKQRRKIAWRDLTSSGGRATARWNINWLYTTSSSDRKCYTAWNPSNSWTDQSIDWMYSKSQSLRIMRQHERSGLRNGPTTNIKQILWNFVIAMITSSWYFSQTCSWPQKPTHVVRLSLLPLRSSYTITGDSELDVWRKWCVYSGNDTLNHIWHNRQK